MPRSCPECGQTTQTQTNSSTVHLDLKCFEKISAKSPNDRALIRNVEQSYLKKGRKFAGPESRPRMRYKLKEIIRVDVSRRNKNFRLPAVVNKLLED